MFSFLSMKVVEKFFPETAKSATRHREARYAEHVAHRRQARFVRPKLEELEGRIVPDAYVFEVNGNPSNGPYTNGQLWTDTNTNTVGNAPGANDTAGIPTGAVCTLNSSTDQSLAGLSVEGTMTIASVLSVQAGSGGSGVTSVGAGGSMTVGSSSNPSADAKLETVALAVAGGATVTDGGPSGGSSGTIDATGTVSDGGLINVGDPGSGMSGTLDASVSTASVSVVGPGVLNVGGTGGSGGTLDAFSLTTTGGGSTFALVVNSSGTVNVKNNATLSSPTKVAGGVINADNIDAYTGASVVFTGIATITSGPLTGNLNAEENASFTFDAASTVTLGAGATLGDGKFFVDGPLAVDTALTASKPEFYLQSGPSASGSIGGTGLIDWWNNEFEWSGGAISLSGGFTIDDNADFKVDGAGGKTLSTTMTNNGGGTADFDGTGALTITGTGTLINEATPILPMEVSLPVIAGAGTLSNLGTLEFAGSSPMTLSCVLNASAGGTIDCATAAAPVTLSDISGASTLDGKINLNNDSLTISGIYTSTSGLDEEWSPNDLTTLTGTLTIASGASDDFDHLDFGVTGSGGAGTVSGAGELSIGANGTNTGDFLDWISGTMTGGGLTIGPYATLSLLGTGTLSRNLDNQGTVEWPNGSGVVFGSGTEVHNEKGGLFDFENGAGGTIPTFTNDGTLELGSGDVLTVDTFTQSSTGTLQSNIASGSSYGSLGVTGTATLDGTLQAELENGYQPPSGTSFDVLDFASSSGQFADVEPQGWSATYNPTSVDLVSP